MALPDLHPAKLAWAVLCAALALLWVREWRLRRRERRLLLRRRRRELAAVHTLTGRVSGAADLRQILRGALEPLQELFGDRGEVVLFNFADGESFLASDGREGAASTAPAATGLPATGFPSEEFERTAFRAAIAQLLVSAGGALRDCMAAERAELVSESDSERLPATVLTAMREAGCKSWMAAALPAQGRIAGVLLIARRDEDRFQPGDPELLRVIARQIGNAIEKVLALEETEKASQHLREAQEQLLQSEKMSAVGQLVAGLAHELNNPLTAILGYSQLMESEKLSARARDFLQKLHRQAQRTQRVVQNLLTFSRQRRPAQGLVDLRRVLDNSLLLREFDFQRHNIAVETFCEAGLPAIRGDEHRLEQVFLNLIGNAVDAILETGHDGLLRIRLYSEQSLVCAEFRDNGSGVKEPAKIFDPFYTTKEIGKGSGLGLSICYGIVQEHEGEIVVVNQPEGGASFILKFPAAQSIDSSCEASESRNPAC